MQIPHIDRNNDVTGVLLAGGKSRRMGYDKALVDMHGQKLFSRSLALLRRYFPAVLIAGDRPDLAQPDIPALPDLYPGSALGGLYTGLRAANTDWIFVAPCDMPYPDDQLATLLLDQRNGFDAVVPRTPNGYEPVFTAYHRNCLPHMEEMLRNNQHRIYDFYQRIAIRYLDWHQMPAGWERALLNINTPEELARFREENA
jgi:molybdopterin-guanine dinucleotide biosynthesis protein A